MTNRIGPNIARLNRLSDLDLSGTEVTDAIIPFIEKLPLLACVNLSETKVTPSGVDELRRAKPGLVIGFQASDGSGTVKGKIALARSSSRIGR